MKSTDKFLVGIVGGVVLLVVVAFIAAYVRPKPSYQSDDVPDGVAYNYLFALQQKDYTRAYSYLSPTLKGHPSDLDSFIAIINQQKWNFQADESSTTIAIEATKLTGDTATVTVRHTTFYNDGLLGRSPYNNNFDMRLRRDKGAWKIISSSAFWAYCWDTQGGCK